ncbi:MAG TPA: hypothetical protein VMD59_11915 [Acidimicrobiales bacterium]|nr:hypothetical protein [Acidimicrobiales bacterium]
MNRDLYISIDIEADGPIPGPTGWGYSMLSLGACLAGRLDAAEGFVALPPDEATFYAELRPISEDVVDGALSVCEAALSMPRARLVELGEEPAAAMRRFVSWVEQAEAQHGGRAVAVGWPSSWDFGTWVFWYLQRFTGSSPFSHGQHRDIRDVLAATRGLPIRGLSKRSLPRSLTPRRPHSHNALDDALEQAELFASVMAEAQEARLS